MSVHQRLYLLPASRLCLAAMSDEEDASSDPQKYTNCKLCKSYVGKSVSRVKCSLCNIVIHTKCFDSLSKIVAIDKENWHCKTCESSLDASKKSPTTLVRENVFFQKQVSLLEKLVNELETVNKLQKEKLETQTSAPIQQPSYADCLKTVSKKSVDVFIKHQGPEKVKFDKVLEKIRKDVNPVELNVQINSTKILNRGVVVKCANDSSCDKLITKLKSSLGSDYSVEKSQKWNPRLYVRGAGKNVSTMEDKDLIDNILILNGFDIEMYANQIKVVKRFDYKYNCNFIIEVTSALRREILSNCNGRIYVDWSLCSCSDHLIVRRCFKCSKFGHLSSKCTSNTQICHKCSDNHFSKDCNSDHLKCINCIEYAELNHFQ